MPFTLLNKLCCSSFSGSLNGTMEEYGWTNFGKRHIVAFMGFMFVFFNYAQRLVIAVSILSMVKNKQTEIQWTNMSSLSCPTSKEHGSSDPSIEVSGDFDWDSLLQSYILSALFVGYTITQIPGGRLAEIYGAKKTLMWSNLMAAFLTIISPLVAQWGAYALAALQLIKGLAQGVLMPATFMMMGLWIPKNERSLLNSMVWNGMNFGSLFGGAITGWLCSMPQTGWPSAFYVMGALNGILAIAFYFHHYETPKSHKSISKEELVYIIGGQEDDMTQERPTAPWRSILTSVPVLAVIFGYSASFWIATYFTSLHPTYVGTVLHYPIRENGYISSLPTAGQAVSVCCSSLFVNWLTKKRYFQTNTLRKGSCAISTIGLCAMLLGVYIAGCDTTANLICTTVAGLFGGFTTLGALIAPNDMSPRFAGSVSGLANTVAGIGAVLCPIIIGAMTKNATLEEWQNAFLLSIGVVLICGMIFVIFGSAEVQPWNYIEQKKETHQTIFTVSRNDKDCIPSLQSKNARTISFSNHTDAFF